MSDEKQPDGEQGECGDVDKVFGDLGPICNEPAGHDGDHIATDYWSNPQRYPRGLEVSRWENKGTAYVTAADLAQSVPVLQLSGEGAAAYEAALRASDEEINRLLLGRYSDGITRVHVHVCDPTTGIYSQPDAALAEVRAGLMKKGGAS